MKPAGLTKEQLEDVIHRLKLRLLGRISMNRVSAEQHRDRDVKLQCEARVAAYSTALLDIEGCLAQEKT